MFSMQELSLLAELLIIKNYVKINNDDSLVSTLSIFHYEYLNSQEGIIALSPGDDFESIKKKKFMDPNEKVSIDDIKIKYIGEK